MRRTLSARTFPSAGAPPSPAAPGPGPSAPVENSSVKQRTSSHFAEPEGCKERHSGGGRKVLDRVALLSLLSPPPPAPAPTFPSRKSPLSLDLFLKYSRSYFSLRNPACISIGAVHLLSSVRKFLIANKFLYILERCHSYAPRPPPSPEAPLSPRTSFPRCASRQPFFPPLSPAVPFAAASGSLSISFFLPYVNNKLTILY